jgi:hypothetical protein
MMHSVTGIFRTWLDAAGAAEALCASGFREGDVNILTPGSDPASVPADTGEQPGIGSAIGGVAGGAAGAAVGMQLLTAASTGLVPGAGPVLAVGAVAAILAGLGGAATGQAIENALTHGIPKDELHLYADALRRGRTIVIALAGDTEKAERARALLGEAGAESLDAARQAWWVGLRDTEARAYGDTSLFARDEALFRRGFEAALRLHGRQFNEAEGQCRRLDPDVYRAQAYRRGYGRGCQYYQRHHLAPSPVEAKSHRRPGDPGGQ